MAATWTDEEKAKAIATYEDSEPTPDNSMEIVKEIAADLDKSPNGVRMVLSKAGVYVKKTPEASGSTGGGAKEGGSKRVSKADAQAALRTALQDAGQTVDDDIVEKLTGKAAQYFAGVITSITESE